MEPEEYFTSIAKVCHEANRAYCQTIGDNSHLPWEEAPEWQKQSAIVGVIWRVANQDMPYSAQHDQWMQDKKAAGWVYGEVKDAEKKTHPCLVEWEELPADERLKDILFCNIVKSLI